MKQVPGTTDTYAVTVLDLPALGQHVRAHLNESQTVEVRVRAVKETRSYIQNQRLWAMLHDVSQQVNWYGKKLADYEWKDVFSASLRKQAVVPGIDGGFVVLGQRTSRMSIREMCDLTTLMMAFGAEPEHRVIWTDPKWQQQGIGRAAAKRK